MVITLISYCTLMFAALSTAYEIKTYTDSGTLTYTLKHDGTQTFYGPLFFGSDIQGSADGTFVIDTTSSYTVVSSTYSASLDC